MNLPHPPLALVALIAVFPLISNVHAADDIFSVTNGNWNAPGNWSTGSVPGATTADVAHIRSGRTATIDTNVNSGSGSITTVYLGGTVSSAATTGTLLLASGGSLTVTGDLEVKRRNQSSSGIFTATGGSFSALDFYIGLGTATTGNGTATLSGSTSATISADTIVGDASGSTGSLEIIGSEVAFSGNVFSLRNTGALKFTLDASGISTLNFSGSANFTQGGSLFVDGSNYTGGSNVFTLVDAGSFILGTINPSQSITGFNSSLYTTSLVFDTVSATLKLNVTAIPEPQTWLMLGAGCLSLVLFHRRKKA